MQLGLWLSKNGFILLDTSFVVLALLFLIDLFFFKEAFWWVSTQG